VRIAAQQARFALPQIREGRLPLRRRHPAALRLVGRGKALEMVLTGQPITAQEALAIGLANRIVRPMR
jgi:enoyl-CoA hydratase/carnithine racemase